MKALNDYLTRVKMNKKISSVVIITILVFIVAIISGFVGITLINSQMKRFYTKPFVNSNLQMEVQKDIEVAEKNILWSMTTDNLTTTSAKINDSNQIIEEVGEHIQSLRQTFDRTDLLDTLDSVWTELKTLHEEVAGLANQNKNEEALEIFNGEYADRATELGNVLEQIEDVANGNATDAYTSSQTLSLFVYITLIVFSVLAVLIGFILTKKLARIIITPVDELKRVAAEMAKGKLDIDINYQSSDELGELAGSFRETCQRLNHIIRDLSQMMEELKNGNLAASSEDERIYVGDFSSILANMKEMARHQSNVLSQISVASGQVSLGSGQLADSAQSLAEGATDQAGAVQELTATVENVTASTEQNADAAQKSYEASDEYRSQAEVSRQQMAELCESMERIDEASRQIETIINEIEDIASQTNLLSLNASIEAARAGEAGKGFAVVADQISKLASESADSAGRTRDLIMRSLSEVDNGNAMAKRAQEGLGDVVDGIEVLAAATKESSENFRTQADTMVQIEQGIEQISSVVQSNSAAAEQTSATSQELSAQAVTLNDLIGQFKLIP